MTVPLFVKRAVLWSGNFVLIMIYLRVFLGGSQWSGCLRKIKGGGRGNEVALQRQPDVMGQMGVCQLDLLTGLLKGWWMGPGGRW